jgi:uncharacterized membrane protein YoaK (UPF0700 family)
LNCHKNFVVIAKPPIAPSSAMTSPSQSGYGTIQDPRSNGQPQRPANDGDNAPLLANPPSSRSSLAKRIRTHMTADIDRTHADIILLACYTITGLLDSSSISIWSSFVSMQTGNTVYLGLGLTDPHGGTRWIKAALSIGCFCAGSFVFSRYHRALSPLKRWVLALSHLTQMLLTVVAALIVMYETRTPADSELRWQVLVPIALIAFQAAGQAVTSRVLKFNALTSVVLTSIYCDLFSDANLFAGIMQNEERNQRAAAPIALLIGVLGGGLWAKSAIGLAGALWTAAGLKLMIIMAWLLWKPAYSGLE